MKDEAVALCQIQSGLIVRAVKPGERCAYDDCPFHRKDIPIGREVVEVSGRVYCDTYCRSEANYG